MADMGGFKDDKKELIKENLKIKNQLHVVNSEYENIKRIYNNLLEEYLDLQFAENFDKVLIIQDEVSDLKSANFRLNEELRLLKEETSGLKLKNKEDSYSQIVILNEENEKLKDELNEKESNLNNLNLEIENLRAQQFSIEKLVEEGNRTKEDLLVENENLKEEISSLQKEFADLKENFEEKEKNSSKVDELNEYIDEFQLEYNKLETEKNEVLLREKELNELIKETKDKLEIQEEKYRLLETEFEKTLESFETLENANIQWETKEKELQAIIEENKGVQVELQNEAEKNKELLEKFDEKELVLNNKISDLEKKNEEQNDYLNAVELELEKQMNNLNEVRESEDRLHSRVFELETNENEKNNQLEVLNEKLKNAEEILLLNEENNFTAMNSFAEMEEKIKLLEKIIAEKNEEIQMINEQKEEVSQIKEGLENEIIYKNSELEQTRFINEDSLNKLAKFERDFLKLKELIEFSEENTKQVEESYRTLEVKYVRTVHRNYDFRLMTSKMFGKFIEEQNSSIKTIKKLEAELGDSKEKLELTTQEFIEKELIQTVPEEKIILENLEDEVIENRLEKEEVELTSFEALVEEEAEFEKLNSEETEIKLAENVYNVLEEFLVEAEADFQDDSFHETKNTLGKNDSRVNIRDIFGREPKEEETNDILNSMICDLESRKEFHIYKSGDIEKEESIVLEDLDTLPHVSFQEIPLEEDIVSKEEGLRHNLKEIYSFENTNEIMEEENLNVEGYFVEEQVQEIKESEDQTQIEETVEEGKKSEYQIYFGENLQQNNRNEDEKTTEDTVKAEFENLFKEETTERVLEEINTDETAKEISEKFFVENKDIFTKDKLEEFTDFLKFMLPRTIEDNIPLLEKDMLYYMVSFAFYNYNGEDFWELLLDKLEIIESDREKYRTYLRKELDAVFKMHNFYQLEDEKGERVAGSIIMHSILPVKQMNEYLNALKNIYTFDLKGNLDKNVFSKLLVRKLQEDNVPKLIKSVNYLQKTGNIEKLYEYSYEILGAIDSKSKGLEIETIKNNVVSEKISNLFDKSLPKKNRFSFEGFYGFGKK